MERDGSLRFPRVTCTKNNGAMELGITYLMMMRQLKRCNPMERAASINSWSFTGPTDARTALAKKVGTKEMAIAIPAHW